MSENPHKKLDFLDLAKHQFAQISAEFEEALGGLKDPDRRRQLTSSYLDLLQKGLAKAQDSVARYQDKLAPQATSEGSGAAPASDSSSAAPPATGKPESGGAPPPEPTN